ncbi:MAG: glycerophosphodiester phosphodiesterase family protein, partial [Gammaproteobacteria bacterium]
KKFVHKSAPVLIAHRGYPSAFPENSLEGITAALEAGACFVEFDIQLSADEVPVLLHDKSLLRTTGVDKSVFDCTLDELRSCSAGEPTRFGSQFQNVRIPTLTDAVDLLRQWPGARAFVEIKRDSLDHHGHELVLDKVMESISPVHEQCIIISFDYQFIAAAKLAGTVQTGWAIKSMRKKSYRQALELAPDFLFFSTRLLPSSAGALWSGPWQWVIYTVNEPEQALQLGELGIGLIETDRIGEMFEHPALNEVRCKHGR